MSTLFAEFPQKFTTLCYRSHHDHEAITAKFRKLLSETQGQSLLEICSYFRPPRIKGAENASQQVQQEQEEDLEAAANEAATVQGGMMNVGVQNDDAASDVISESDGEEGDNVLDASFVQDFPHLRILDANFTAIAVNAFEGSLWYDNLQQLLLSDLHATVENIESFLRMKQLHTLTFDEWGAGTASLCSALLRHVTLLETRTISKTSKYQNEYVYEMRSWAEVYEFLPALGTIPRTSVAVEIKYVEDKFDFSAVQQALEKVPNLTALKLKSSYYAYTSHGSRYHSFALLDAVPLTTQLLSIEDSTLTYSHHKQCMTLSHKHLTAVTTLQRYATNVTNVTIDSEVDEDDVKVEHEQPDVRIRPSQLVTSCLRRRQVVHEHVLNNVADVLSADDVLLTFPQATCLTLCGYSNSLNSVLTTVFPNLSQLTTLTLRQLRYIPNTLQLHCKQLTKLILHYSVPMVRVSRKIRVVAEGAVTMEQFHANVEETVNSGCFPSLREVLVNEVKYMFSKENLVNLKIAAVLKS